VGFAVQAAALGMPCQRPAAPELLQHGRRDFARVGALGMRADVLRAPGNRAALQGLGRLGQVGKRHADPDFAMCGRVGRTQGLEQRGVFGQATVHLPVAQHETGAVFNRGHGATVFGMGPDEIRVKPKIVSCLPAKPLPPAPLCYTVRMILPMFSPASIMAWAADACSSGKVACTTGLMLPASSRGQACLRKDLAMAPLNSTGRGRSVEPVIVSRRRRIWLPSTSARAPPSKAMMTMRPSSARHLRLRLMYSPATMSRITLTPAPPVASRTSWTKSCVL